MIIIFKKILNKICICLGILIFINTPTKVYAIQIKKDERVIKLSKETKNLKEEYKVYIKKNIEEINRNLKQKQLITNVDGEETLESKVVKKIIPEEILNIIYEKNVRVLVADIKEVSENLYENELIKIGRENNFLPGFYKLDGNDDKNVLGIYAKYYDKVIAYNDTRSVIHELGHAIDNLLLNTESNFTISNTDTFKSIYKEEKEGGEYSEYSTLSEDEYFAEMFMYFYTVPQKLKYDKPRTYGFLKKILGQLEIDNGMLNSFIKELKTY